MFFQWQTSEVQYYLRRRASINTFSETNNDRRKITQYDGNTHETVLV